MIIFTPVYDDKLVCCVFIYNETTQIILYWHVEHLQQAIIYKTLVLVFTKS